MRFKESFETSWQRLLRVREISKWTIRENFVLISYNLIKQEKNTSFMILLYF